MFAEGVAFDGSSIAGWKAINESDMMLIPIRNRRISIRSSPSPPWRFLRHRRSDHRRSLQPRPAHDRQEGRSLREVRRFRRHHLRRPGSRNSSCSTMSASPPIRTTPASSSIQRELPSNMGSEYETGNLGHRPRTKGGYFPVPPVDSARTSAPKCCPSWPKWAFRSKSITTKWPLPSTNSA
jgi:glutamine synthetase